MNQPSAQSSVCFLDNKHVYSIGGYRADPLRTHGIEHLEPGVSKKWTEIDIVLPRKLVLAGCLPLSSNQLLIFGGKDDDGLKSLPECYMLNACLKPKIVD